MQLCGEEYLVAGRGQVTIEGPRGAVSKGADMASCGAWRRRRRRTRRMSWPGSRGGGRSRENEATPCSKITFWVSSVSWAGQRDLKESFSNESYSASDQFLVEKLRLSSLRR